MPRAMRSQIMLIAAIAASVSGGATWGDRQRMSVFPPTDAPLIVMNAVLTSRVIPVSSAGPLPMVEILDHRPGPKRYYYPGSLEPRHWLDGMSMVPMEAFDPTIEEQIRAHCVASASRSDLAAVSSEPTSFQLVVAAKAEEGERRIQALLDREERARAQRTSRTTTAE